MKKKLCKNKKIIIDNDKKSVKNAFVHLCNSPLVIKNEILAKIVRVKYFQNQKIS